MVRTPAARNRRYSPRVNPHPSSCPFHPRRERRERPAEAEAGPLGPPPSDGVGEVRGAQPLGTDWSGRRGSNPRPTAWKAVTLPLSYSRLRVSLNFAYSPLRRGKPLSFASAPAAAPSASLKNLRQNARCFSQASEGWWRGEDSNLRSRWGDRFTVCCV
jgi:hypothetical protein